MVKALLETPTLSSLLTAGTEDEGKTDLRKAEFLSSLDSRTGPTSMSRISGCNFSLLNCWPLLTSLGSLFTLIMLVLLLPVSPAN